MKTRIVCAILVPLCTLSFTGPADKAADRRETKLSARLTGFNEVTPKLTSAAGKFSAVVDRSGTSVSFTLTFSDLSSPVLFSHIHFGQPGVNGGVMVFFCSNATSGPQPRPCPTPGGTVSGTFTAQDVVGAVDQGIGPDSLDQVLAAIASGQTYVNVHSERWPGGEIRGQVETRAHEKDEHDRDEHGQDKHEKDEH